MKVIEHYASLWEVYHNLLSPRQSSAFYSFICDDLSLSEIADLLEISRQAVHEQVQKAAQLLDDYEDKLQFFQRQQDLQAKLAAITELEDLDDIKFALSNLQNALGSQN